MMNWHKGDASSAIKISKETKSLFIVYIKGNDSISASYDEFWSSDNIVYLIQQENCVALTIESSGEVFQQFSQIYPVMIIPTIYFIGNDGKPLEVIVGRLNPDAFCNKINHALELHKNQLSSLPLTAQASERAISSSDKDCKADQLSLDEKAERARLLIAEKKGEKERQEREQQREREQERRQLGQDLNKLKQLKAEVEMKEAKDEIRKQKEDEKKALEQIRKQLELDRQERAKNFYQAKNVEEKKLAESTAKKQKVDEQERQAELAEKMKNARIQFRLPDGSALVQTFPSDQLFQTAYDYIRQNTMMRDFTMSTTFPKREFIDADKLNSFSKLGLAPSSILIVLPMSIFSNRNISESSGERGLFSMIFSPIFILCTLICTFLSGLLWPQTAAAQSLPSSGGNAGPSRSDAEHNLEDANSKLEDQRKKKIDNIGLRQRKEGNIHRLSADDDDDENNTYNGNSTQQM